MALFNLIARLGLNTAGFETGLKRADSLATRFSKNVSSSVKGHLAAAFGTGAIIAAAKNTLDYAGKIKDLSQALGVGTTALQEFDYAAGQNGATLEDFASVLKRLQIARNEALKDPAGEMVKSFKQLGVTIDDLKKKRVEDLLKQIGVKFRFAADVQPLAAPAFKTMGKGAGDIFAALSQGLDEAAEAAARLGIIIDEPVVDALDDAGDRFTDLVKQIRGPFAEAMVFVLERLKDIGTTGKLVGDASQKEGFNFLDLLIPGSAGFKFGRYLASKDAQDIVSGSEAPPDGDGNRKRDRRPPIDFPMLLSNTKRREAPTVNALQQIGAFVATPGLMEQRQTLSELQTIRSHLAEIRRHTDPKNSVARSSW